MQRFKALQFQYLTIITKKVVLFSWGRDHSTGRCSENRGRHKSQTAMDPRNDVDRGRCNLQYIASEQVWQICRGRLASRCRSVRQEAVSQHGKAPSADSMKTRKFYVQTLSSLFVRRCDRYFPHVACPSTILWCMIQRQSRHRANILHTQSPASSDSLAFILALLACW